MRELNNEVFQDEKILK